MHGPELVAAAGAYHSSGLVEESAQGGDLEERVERHVVICARASGVVASVLAGVSASHSGVSASRRLVGAGSEGARCLVG